MIENYIIIYDIQGDNRKYNKIYKLLNQVYSKRIQKSVFLVQDERKEVLKISNRIKKIINQDTDKFLIIPLCENDWNSVEMVGTERKKAIERKEFLML